MAGWKFFLDGIEVEEPIGWDAIEFTAIRMDSHGIDQPFSTEVKFYGKGAKHIKKIYDNFFINQPIAIQIIGDTAVNGQPYEFNGFLNLSIYQEFNACDTDTWEITVGIIDDEFRERFKSRQDIEVDLNATKDLDGNTIDPCVWESTRLHKQELYLVAAGQNLADINGSLSVFANAWSAVPRFLPLYWNNSDFKDQYGTTFDSGGGAYDYFDKIPIFKNNTDYTRTLEYNWTIKGKFNFQQNSGIGNTANIKFQIGILQPFTFPSPFYVFIPVNTVQSPIDTLGGGFTDFDLSLSGTITVGTTDATNKIGIRVSWGDDGAFAPTDPAVTAIIGYSITDMCFKLSEKNNFEYATFADTMRIENFIRRLIYIYTGSNNKLLSTTFSKAENGDYWNNALTNGLRIRNAPTTEEIANGCAWQEGSQNENLYQVSFKKIFEGLDSIFCLGWAFEWDGAEWKIRVETRDYFYQNIINDEFNHVGEVTQSVKADMLANQVTLGYDDQWKNINTAGIWAIHTNRNYFIANKAMNENSSNKLDLRSSIIAEGYAIEISRKLQFFENNSGSSDRPNDYATFIIWLNRNTLEIENVEESEYALLDETGNATFMAGTVSMSSNRIAVSNSVIGAIYNVWHTPARIAARWWKVLGMHTYGLTNPIISYQSGQYQVNYSSRLGDSSIAPILDIKAEVVIPENTNIFAALFIDAAKEYLFRPIEIEFKYPQSLCDFLILSDKQPYGKVKLTSGSLNLSGYITQIANQPEDNAGGTTSFKLLASNIADPEPTGERAYSDAYSNAYL